MSDYATPAPTPPAPSTVTVAVTAPTRRTHGVAGAIAGLFLGLFITLDLMLFDVVPFESWLAYAIPIIGLVIGGLIGRLGVFGTRRPRS